MKMNFDVVFQNMPFLLAATLVTVEITLISFLLALCIAFVVGTLRYYFKSRTLGILLMLYVEIFRGSPLLIQLFLIYYGLPSVGVVMSAFTAGILGLALNGGAYISEIIRASFMSVDKGQREAAFSLGYSNLKTIYHIILPQAIRIAIPSLMNSFSSILKDSSLVSVISITELARAGNLIYYRTTRPFEIYLTLGIFYILMTVTISLFSKYLEGRSRKWGL